MSFMSGDIITIRENLISHSSNFQTLMESDVLTFLRLYKST